MNLKLEDAVARLKKIPAYDAWFTRVFPQEGVTGDTIAKAIATFERTVVASHAPFDEWVEGNENAVSDSAKRGFKLFVGKAACAGCHSGWNFTDNAFHDIGVSKTDPGRGAIEPDNVLAQFAFKTPSLRDVAQRAPYFHNGEAATLDAVMDHYIVGGIQRPSMSPKMAPVALTGAEVDDIIAFMRSLTGKRQVVALPVLPN
jgi:cytochrome c peroxidase